MIQVVLLGTGNVATHLYKALSASKRVNIKQVYNRSSGGLSFFERKTAVTTSLTDLVDADIYLLALKDDVIPEVARQLEHKKGLVVHTSGAVSIENLKSCPRRGVLYPLQTFSKELEIDYSKIPFCLEANNPADLELLKILAGEISDVIFEISSEQRKKLHLAAVFVCNFVNYLYAVGEDICADNNIPFKILQPLIEETAEKIKSSSPSQVQTGPAKRGDEETIKNHLALLSKTENKQIYTLLTHAIQSTYGKKL